jgi:hypothetical protein
VIILLKKQKAIILQVSLFLFLSFVSTAEVSAQAEVACVRQCSNETAACYKGCNSNATCSPCTATYNACTSRCSHDAPPPTARSGVVR